MSANISMAMAPEMASTTSQEQQNNEITDLVDTSPSAPLLENIEEPIVSLKPDTTYSFTGNALSHNTDTNSSCNSSTCGSNDTGSTTDTKGTENKEQTTTAGDNGDGKGKKDEPEDSMYECNICLDTAKDAVVSMCGHLFCWPCLHQWMQTRPNRKMCPVCKAAISKEKVIPLYGRNSTRQEDPRNKVPPRPAGQRTEPEQPGLFPSFSMNNFHMSFGIGVFPFGYFSVNNFTDSRPQAAHRGTPQFEEEQQLSRFFCYFAFFCLVWLLFA